MGKYDELFNHVKINGVVTDGQALTTVLSKIANELAEANRLKRIELDVIDRSNGSGILFLNQKELVDRA